MSYTIRNIAHDDAINYAVNSEKQYDYFCGLINGFKLAIEALRSDNAAFQVSPEDWELTAADCANWLEKELEREN